MNAKVREKEKAIELRRQGLSYKQIINKLKVAKGSLSLWFKDVKLTEDEERLLNQRTLKTKKTARKLAALTNIKRRIERDSVIEERSRNTFRQYLSDPSFSYGIVMYWAEGSKKHRQFQFVNSDPDALVLMLFWIEKYLEIDRCDVATSIYIHKVYQDENCEKYWSEILGIPQNLFKKTIFKPTKHLVKRNLEYKGCVRLSVGGVNNFVLVMTWQKLLKEYYYGLSPCSSIG